MKRLQKHLILAAVLVGLTTVTTMLNPQPASAASSSSVQVVPNSPFGEMASAVAGSFPTITVPSTKHLVIETLSLAVIVPYGSQAMAYIRYTSGGNSAMLFVPMTLAYSTTGAGAVSIYIVTQEVRLYADPGTSVSFEPYIPYGNLGPAYMTVSGYQH
jgi:hypothetical protein